MRQIVGVVGSGLIGDDPFDPQCWSGSSRRFFMECQSRGLLKRAFGVEVSRPSKYWFALKNYSRDERRWRTQFYSDPSYRQSLTDQVKDRLGGEDFASDFLQLGAMYDCPGIVKGRAACYSYNDGNFWMSSQSPFFPAGISSKVIESALQYEREVNARLDMIFTMSEYLRRSFINDYGISPDKVTSIGAGINLDSLPEIDPGKDYSAGNILFVGVDFERKGGNDVLKAFQVVREQNPNATLHVVGPRQIPSGLANLPGVVWHGFLRKTVESEMQKLRDLLRHAVLFVMPSLYEPFGIAPLEAMSYGIPCIVSNAWALPEVVPDRVCGRLVEPGKWEELAGTVQKLLGDPDLLRQYGTASRSHVEQNYTWAKVVARLEMCLAKGSLEKETANRKEQG